MNEQEQKLHELHQAYEQARKEVQLWTKPIGSAERAKAEAIIDAVSDAWTSAQQAYTVPVKVGTGAKVHAGIVVGFAVRGRHTTAVYGKLCGSGDSTFSHNWRKARVAKLYGEYEITCKHCKQQQGS